MTVGDQQDLAAGTGPWSDASGEGSRETFGLGGAAVALGI